MKHHEIVLSDTLHAIRYLINKLEHLMKDCLTINENHQQSIQNPHD